MPPTWPLPDGHQRVVPIQMMRLLIVGVFAVFRPDACLIDPKIVGFQDSLGEVDDRRMHEEAVQLRCVWVRK